MIGALNDLAAYLDTRGLPDRLSGGARRLPIDTRSGRYFVWTKRVGHNPGLKVLLLHGGPGSTHEYLEAFDSFFPAAGIEYYDYDQLGSGHSDRPDAPELWQLDRFVDEVEQVRQGLELTPRNFVLYGQSWGGLLAIEYALAYPGRLRGLVISNMMASAPAYTAYAESVLAAGMDQNVLAEIRALEAAHDTDNPRYLELLIPNFYEHHVLRMRAGEWPDPVRRGFSHINPVVYVLMQGPSELGMSPEARLARWDRLSDLVRITVPTLVIGAEHDTMDPEHLREMARLLPEGRYHHCPKGSHLALYDHQEAYFDGSTAICVGELRG